MNDTKLQRLIEFQSIAIEEMESDNYESAQGFAEDVLKELQDEVE